MLSCSEWKPGTAAYTPQIHSRASEPELWTSGIGPPKCLSLARSPQPNCKLPPRQLPGARDSPTSTWKAAKLQHHYLK